MLDETGAILREARIDACVPQGQLAGAMGISIWTLSRVEHGERSFQPEWVNLLPEPIQEKVAAHLRAKLIGRAWRIPCYQDEAAA